jgi:formylglycine-generating enzyme required for sulfatase activity
MRQRAQTSKRRQEPDPPGGWRPTIIFGVLIGLASFGFAFDFATDGKIRHMLGLGAVPSEVAAADNSAEGKKPPPPEPQKIAKVAEPTVAPPPPPVAAELPVPEVPKPVVVVKAPVENAPLAVKPEPAILPIPEPTKSVQPELSLAEKLAEAAASAAPAVEPSKPPVAADAESDAPKPAAPDASPPVQAAPAPEKSVEPAKAEVAPPAVVTPPQATAPAPVVATPVQQGNVIRDCADCPQLVAVTAGSFMRVEDARPGTPPKTIAIDHNFAIGRYEVTFDDWNKCVVGGGCSPLSDDGGWGRGNRPQIFVSYGDITTQYLPWLSKLTGNVYRLPSKDEWQYAAAGGAGAAQAKGNAGGAAAECFNASGAAAADCTNGFNGTAPVGSFQPNALGLYDMKGNVWEWSAECWQPFTYAANTSDASCDTRVVLGGAWSTTRNKVTGQTTGWEKSSRKTNSIGFRVVRSLP